MSNEIVVSNQAHEMFLPIMSIEVAMQRRNHLVGFVKGIMVDGHDFGKVPGTGDKPTLLKPGAEKLVTFFGLTPVFVPVSVTEDWTGEQHGGEPLFYYRYKCELWRMGNLIATGEGSCNSRESKYRYRKGERTCPQCGAAAIIPGKAEYGGGWLCFGKKGGCGAKFKKGDPVIESQEVGKVLNPDIADLVNTIQKMAQKRAMVAAVLVGVNASEFFTQDIEDLATDAEYTVVEPPKSSKPQPAQAQQSQRQPAPVVVVEQPQRQPEQPEVEFMPPVEANPFNAPAEPPAQQKATNGKPKAGLITEGQKGTLHALGEAVYGDAWDTKRPELVKIITDGRTTSSNDLYQSQAARLISGDGGTGGLEGRLRRKYEALAEQVQTAAGADFRPESLANIDSMAGVELAAAYRALAKLAPLAQPVGK